MIAFPEQTVEAIDLRVGDVIVGGGSEITVTGLELRDDGLIRYRGKITAGRDRGYVGSWSVQFTQQEAVRLPRP